MKTTIRIATLFMSGCIIIGTMDSARAQSSQGWNLKSRESAQANTSAAISLLNAGQLQEAVNSLRRATTEDASDPQPFQILGLALGMQGQYAEALDALRKSYALRPTNETLLSTGIIYYLQRDYDAAINAWNKVLQANPDLASVYGDVGMALLRKGSLSEAGDAFQKLVHGWPNSDLGYYGLALCNYLEGNFSAAREEAERALTLRKDAQTVLLLANLDLVQGDRVAGKRRAQQYTAMIRGRDQGRSMTELGFPSQQDFHWDPFGAETVDNVYLLQARFENDPRARAALSAGGHAKLAVAEAAKQLSHAPGDLFLTQQLALVEMANGDFARSVEHLLTVVQQFPAVNSALLDLGRAMSLDGQNDLAAQQIREFKRKVPNQEISKLFTQSAPVEPAAPEEATPEKSPQKPETPEPKPETLGPKPVPSTEF